METSLTFWTAGLAAVMIAGLSKGGFGSGAAFASTPILALAVGPTMAAGILLPVLCLMDVVAIRAFWGKWDKRNARALMMACVPGVLLGTATFRFLDAHVLKIMIGALAIMFVFYGLFKSRLNPAPAPFSTWKAWFWGATAGFTSFAAHAGGPPIAMHLLPQRMDKTTYQATNAAFFGWVNLVKLIPYFALGLFTPGNLAASAILAPVAAASVALGVVLHKRMSDAWFYRSVYALLTLTALKLIYDGF